LEKIPSEFGVIHKQQAFNNGKNDNTVLHAHEAYKKLSRNKPSPISLEWVTKLCGEYGVEKVLSKIEIMGKKNWLKIEMLEGLLQGIDYDKPAKSGIVIMEDPRTEEMKKK